MNEVCTVCNTHDHKMQVFVDLLNAKRIVVEVTSLDTVESLKKKISQATRLPISEQILHISQNGSKVEVKNGSHICLGDLIKPKTIVNLSCKQNYSTAFFHIKVVTETGQVLSITPEGGNSARICDLREKLSAILGLPAESLFLREVDMLRYVNKGLTKLYNTLEEFCVNSGSVLYVQIHPWRHNWFHGKITRDQAEQVMSSATDGKFLVKESVNFPGDYVLFVCIDGKIRHYRVVCKKNMMFTINEQQFFNSIDQMVKFYQNSKGLPIKLTEPVSRLESHECTDGSSLYSGEGSFTNSTLPRHRLQTTASSEIQLHVVVGSETYSLLTNLFNQVHSLKVQIAELSGIPTEWQLLRLYGKPLVMNEFLLGDHHIVDNSKIYVQVHPWSEEWYIGKMSASDMESVVKGVSVEDGMFLIRESITYPGDYCLHLWWKGKSLCYRVEINKKNHHFMIDNVQQFATLSLLVEYYKSHCGSLKTRLTKPVKFDKEQRGLIPPAVLARGSKAKAAYKRALKHGKTCDIRVRVMLIGQDSAGKTSVKRSLKGETFNKQETSTLGVEMDTPLVKAGIKAWKAHQADDTTTVFDHRSAQLVARQLSGASDDSSGSPTQSSAPDLPKEYPTKKSPLWNSESCAEDSFVFQELSSGTNVFSNGFGNHVDLATLQINGMDERDDGVKPSSPFLQDEVFVSNPESSDDLPQTVISLVERILQQEHSAVGEEVWPVIWDFSGRSLFHAMHPIFMSQEAVYLLVCDLSKELFKRSDTCVLQPGLPGHSGRGANMVCNGESSLDHLMRWMDLVHSFQGSNKVTVSGISQPPVILVGTHADKVVGDPWIPMNAFLDSFHGKAFASHIVDETFAVDNTRSGQSFQQEDQNIQRLRQKVIAVASTLPHIQREIPLQWLYVEKVLHRLASNGVKHVTKAEFKAIAERICCFEVQEDCDTLLHFLCDCGALLCFNEADESKTLVILDLQWLIHVFCQVISVVHRKKEPMAIREHRQNLAKRGILSEDLVNSACETLGLKFSKEVLLSIMEKSNLVCRWDAPNGEAIYLVPSVLTAKPEDEISGSSVQGSIAPVYLTFNTGYIPYGFFARFLMLFGQWASREHSAKSPKLFANAARFFIGRQSEFSLMFACFKSVIIVHLVHDGKDEVRETAAVCQQVCRCVEDILDCLRQQCQWLHSMIWQLCARCDLCVGESDGPDGCMWHHTSCCLHPDCAHFISLDSDPLRCDQTLKHNTRLDEDKLKPWLKNFRRNYYPDLLPYKLGQVSHEDRLLLAHDLGLQWRGLCCILLGEMEMVHIDHDQTKLYDKCFVMLTRWTESQGSHATYAALGTALMHEDLHTEHLCTKYCLESQGVLESSV